MEKILEVAQVRKTFYKNKKQTIAVADISFSIGKGECLGLVGESGCGKSTTAKIITGLEKAEGGRIVLKGQEIQNAAGRKRRDIYKEMQMVFQTPQESFDPRRTVGYSIMEGLRNNKMSRSQARQKMRELLKEVELEEELAQRYPHEMSGGQCQRAAIARALALEPSLLICDEATSALDVTIQAQMVSLLQRLKKDHELSILLICHDLALVQAMCEQVVVMKDGEVVEAGRTQEIFKHPQKEYTKKLLEASF